MVFETISAANFDTPAHCDATGGHSHAGRRAGLWSSDQNGRMGVPERLFRIIEELKSLDEEEALVRAELEAHRHINDDAVRDAAVSDHYLDLEEAELTSADVARFTTALDRLGRRRAKLEEKRQRLLSRLG